MLWTIRRPASSDGVDGRDTALRPGRNAHSKDLVVMQMNATTDKSQVLHLSAQERRKMLLDGDHECHVKIEREVESTPSEQDYGERRPRRRSVPALSGRVRYDGRCANPTLPLSSTPSCLVQALSREITARSRRTGRLRGSGKRVPPEKSRHKKRGRRSERASPGRAMSTKKKRNAPKRHTEPGHTPLHCASQRGHVEVVKALLGARAEPNRANKEGHTPLYYACSQGHVEVVKALLAAGADPNRAYDQGYTALHWSASQGLVEAVRALLAASADPNKSSAEGWTPLHFASASGHAEVARELVSHRANIATSDKNGFSPLHYATWSQHVRIQLSRIADIIAFLSC